MKGRNILSLLVFFIIGASCTTEKTPAPYFGNGFHNGWADQNSILIWTRLTQTPEGNTNGQEFLEIDVKEMHKISDRANSEEINSSQIPEGFTLDQMIGACPGSEGEVKLTYHPIKNQIEKIETEWVSVDVDKNYTHQWQLTDLTPDTKYIVQIESRGLGQRKVTDVVKGAFKTPPAVSEEKEVDFCIVTCHDYIRKDSTLGHKIYDTMLRLFPDFYIHTGDIEYYDKPRPYAMTEEMMRFKWDRLFALPLQRDFYKQVTTYFMKDDHDALKNDAFIGSKYGTVTWERGLEIFDKEQFPTSPNKNYKTVRWGKDLQFWIVESRNFRSPNTMKDGAEKTILGQEQKEWLFETMKASDATFKLLVIPNPILGPDRKNKHDNHSNQNFKHEGDELRGFLNQIDNVYIINGDRHWQYVTHLDGTNLWEFSVGAGSNSHAGGWKKGDIRPEHRFLRVGAGFLKGKVSRDNEKSKLTLQHCNVEGEVVHQEIFEQ
jgi:alkaline phosphatase D